MKLLNEPITGDTKEAKQGAIAARDSRLAEECVRRWAYRLAPAPGPNREIAEAALGGCTDGINRAAISSGIAYQQTLEEATRDAARDYGTKALFAVVQARAAGGCDAR